MILSTHAVAGAAISIAFRGNPIVGLIAAFLSHFALDAVPHWHYRILSKIEDKSSPFGKKLAFGKNFIKDLFRTGTDFGIGLIVSFLVSRVFFPEYFWLAALGAFAGALPDLLQVIYYRFPNFKPLYWFQWFHEKMHAEKRLDNEPVKWILSATAIAVVAIFITIAIS